jgi:hypothetical protein
MEQRGKGQNMSKINKVTILISYKDKKIIRINRNSLVLQDLCYINLGEPTDENISKIEEGLEDEGFQYKRSKNYPGGVFQYWEKP